MRLLTTLCCAAALTVALTSTARADEFNKQTILTFSGPVQIPGVTLPAGTYQFKLADIQGQRHIVQVFDKDGRKAYGTFMTVPVQSAMLPPRPIIMFAERPAGQPQAVRVWYYPGDRIGDEFVYPKAQATAIAKAAHEPVLAFTDDTTGTTLDKNSVNGTGKGLYEGAKVARVDENGNMTDIDAKPKTSAQPSGEPSNPNAVGTSGSAPQAAQPNRSNRAAQPAPAPSASARGTAAPDDSGSRATARTASGRRSSLPRTASSLALVESLSFLAFALALATRRVRQHLACVRTR